jgi:hypothetical protein
MDVPKEAFFDIIKELEDPKYNNNLNMATKKKKRP